jgi:acetyl esterase/lipase
VIFGGRRHFRDLMTQNDEGIASNVLASRLRKLVEAGLLSRDDATRGQKATYTLTEGPRGAPASSCPRPHHRPHRPIFTRESLAQTTAMYLAGADPHQPMLSPAVLADLTGFPPMLIQVGTNEILLDDSTRLAARARAAGVDVILDITADVPHVFQSFAGILDEADEALDRAALFLSQRIRAGGTAHTSAG